jgi:SAM-dependent methyltransferase
MELPEHMLASRRRIAGEYLRGNGIEIGALYAPVEMPARIRYVDRLSLTALRKQYPELAEIALAPVDIVDDGERLLSFAADGLDFIVANHMLEHCENPLGTLRVHLAKVRPGGVLYYAIPDKCNSFDSGRPLTSIGHLLDDDRDGGESSRFSHYVEWEIFVNGIADPAAAERQARRTMQARYSIHFHVWDEPAWREFLGAAITYLGGTFEILHFERNDTELVSVLRRST